PEISRRVCDNYHNLEHDEMVNSIFNSGKNNAGVGMNIPSWMITNEMKLMENYQMYAEVFEVDVPTTESQPTESIQGTHRTTSAPRSPNPDVDEGESSFNESILLLDFVFHKDGQLDSLHQHQSQLIQFVGNKGLSSFYCWLKKLLLVKIR
ncbi:hypothetical protein Tco_0075112, partial [Tanacetum coccineum]